MYISIYFLHFRTCFLVSISRMCCSSTRKKKGKIEQVSLRILIDNKITRKSAGHHGGVAQMVERSLSMREARGSIPRTSSFFCLSLSLSPVSSEKRFYRSCQYLHINFDASSTYVMCELTKLSFFFALLTFSSSSLLFFAFSFSPTK